MPNTRGLQQLLPSRTLITVAYVTSIDQVSFRMSTRAGITHAGLKDHRHLDIRDLRNHKTAVGHKNALIVESQSELMALPTFMNEMRTAHDESLINELLHRALACS